MHHGYVVVFLQSQEGITVELLGSFFKRIFAVACAKSINKQAPNMNASVREVYLPIPPE